MKLAAQLLEVMYDRGAPIERRAQAGTLWLELVPRTEREDGHGAEVFVAWMASWDRRPCGEDEGRPLREWEEPTRHVARPIQRRFGPIENK